MDMDGASNDLLLAGTVGELKGLVKGLSDTLNQQNIDSAKYRAEQMQRDVQGRQEFMEMFKGMRDDNKEQTKILQKTQEILTGLVSWQTEVSPKIKMLWDSRNNQKGFIAAIIFISSIVSAIVGLAVEWFKKG